MSRLIASNRARTTTARIVVPAVAGALAAAKARDGGAFVTLSAGLQQEWAHSPKLSGILDAARWRDKTPPELAISAFLEGAAADRLKIFLVGAEAGAIGRIGEMLTRDGNFSIDICGSTVASGPDPHCAEMIALHLQVTGADICLLAMPDRAGAQLAVALQHMRCSAVAVSFGSALASYGARTRAPWGRLLSSSYSL
jgi:hypothetical protein